MSVCVGGGIVVSSALVRLALLSASSSSDVVVESEFGSMWASSMLDVVVVSVVGRCDVVRVKIVNPDSVVVAGVSRATESRLPGVDSWMALGLAVGVFFLSSSSWVYRCSVSKW